MSRLQLSSSNSWDAMTAVEALFHVEAAVIFFRKGFEKASDVCPLYR